MDAEERSQKMASQKQVIMKRGQTFQAITASSDSLKRSPAAPDAA